MRQISKITIPFFALIFALSILSIIPNQPVVAQITPTEQPGFGDFTVNDDNWVALIYPTTVFENPAWLINYGTLGLTLDWGNGPPTDPFLGLPLDGVPADGFAVRFSTNPPFNAGIYDFTVTADGGVRVTVNDTIIIDQLDNRGPATFVGTAFVGSGAGHVVFEYIDYEGNASFDLQWEDVTDFSEDAEAEDISNLPGITTAEVLGVDGLALRTGPYLGASLVAVLRPGQTYGVLAQNNLEGDYPWYQLVINEQGQTGWASGRYLNVDLEIETTYACEPTPEFINGVNGILSPLPDQNQASCALVALNAVNEFGQTGAISEITQSTLIQTCYGVAVNVALDNTPIPGTVFTVGQVIDLVLLVGPLLETLQSCTTISTPGITIPEANSVFEELVTLPDTGATISPRTVLNIRVRPSTRTATTGQIPWGGTAQLLARTIEAGSDHWYLVRYNGIIGWVDASFVNVRGNLADVPTY